MTGHKKKVGDWFESKTPRLFRNSTPQLQYHRPGTQAFFQHKNRRYFCEVLGCIEKTSGWCYGVWEGMKVEHGALDKRVRWYQFTYVVRILEN